MGVLSRLMALPRKYPILRGMIAYSIVWPTSSFIQQCFLERGKSDDINYLARAFRYGLFGSCFMAPSYFLWMKLSTRIWPGKDLLTAVKKAFIEQVTYGPYVIVCFYFGMSALEMKPFRECVEEIRLKAWPTMQVAFFAWPAFQTFNFYFVPEKNRVVFVSVGSLVWTCFLSHMKSLGKEDVHLPHLLQEIVP